MALNKVEICGVNTSKLPVLKPGRKRGAVSSGSNRGMMEARELIHQRKSPPGLKRDHAVSRTATKMLMTSSRLGVSVL